MATSRPRSRRSRQGKSTIYRNRLTRTPSNAPCSPRRTAHPSRPRTRCRPIGCAGSTSSGSLSCATATFPRPRVGSRCTAALCSASSPNMRRGAESRNVGASALRAPSQTKTDGDPAGAGKNQIDAEEEPQDVEAGDRPVRQDNEAEEQSDRAGQDDPDPTRSPLHAKGQHDTHNTGGDQRDPEQKGQQCRGEERILEGEKAGD